MSKARELINEVNEVDAEDRIKMGRAYGNAIGNAQKQ